MRANAKKNPADHPDPLSNRRRNPAPLPVPQEGLGVSGQAGGGDVGRASRRAPKGGSDASSKSGAPQEKEQGALTPTVFLNLPFSSRAFDRLIPAYVFGVALLGCRPILGSHGPSSDRRLSRLILLIRESQLSITDLSYFPLSGEPLSPRLNCVLELGLWVGIHGLRKERDWLILDRKPHRLVKDLSDIIGSDPQIYDGTPDGLLKILFGYFGRRMGSFDAALETLRLLLKASRKIRKEFGPLYKPLGFSRLVAAAERLAEELRSIRFN
jgi:hypothetical protein